jgi:hypothetical protein
MLDESLFEYYDIHLEGEVVSNEEEPRIEEAVVEPQDD